MFLNLNKCSRQFWNGGMIKLLNRLQLRHVKSSNEIDANTLSSPATTATDAVKIGMQPWRSKRTTVLTC